MEEICSFVTGPVINTKKSEKGDCRYRQVVAVLHSFRVVRDYKRVAAGRVEQVTAIHRFNIMEFRTGLFIGDRYRQVTVIAGSTVYLDSINIIFGFSYNL